MDIVTIAEMNYNYNLWMRGKQLKKIKYIRVLLDINWIVEKILEHFLFILQ